jgi:hypothetical protein
VSLDVGIERVRDGERTTGLGRRERRVTGRAGFGS